MSNLKYTVIKNESQYMEYCETLEKLIFKDEEKYLDETELLTLLIEQWDCQHNSFSETNPVELIKSLMKQNSLKSKDLADILGLSKGTVSKILNYQKGLSKDVIRKLSAHFNVSQEALNKPYPIQTTHQNVS